LLRRCAPAPPALLLAVKGILTEGAYKDGIYILHVQLYLAVYFCLIDTILWIQYFYYNYYYPKRHLTLPPSTTSINSLADGSAVVSSEPPEPEESQALLSNNKQRLYPSLQLGGRARRASRPAHPIVPFVAIPLRVRITGWPSAW